MNEKVNFQKPLKLAFPITIIVFILLTKWWIVDVIDGSDCVMYGFPLIYKSPAFYTSLAEQYFVKEFLIDFLFYFVSVFGILFLINKFISELKLKRKLLIIIYVIAGILFGLETLMATVFETSFSIQRDFDIVVKQTGAKFYFSDKERKEFDKFHQ